MPNDFLPLIHVMAEMVRPDPGRRHIFVYDVLLDEDRLKGTCPEAEFVSAARLHGRRWIINTEQIPTVEAMRDHAVYGAVWSVPDASLAALDFHFGYPQIAERRGAFARGPLREMIPVEFYAHRNHRHGLGNIETVLRMLALGRQWGFPRQYVEAFGAWAPRGSKPRSTAA